MSDEPTTEPIMGFSDQSPREAIWQALGAASVCWNDMEGAGEFDASRANQIGEELFAYLRLEPPTLVEANPDEEPKESLVDTGDWVTVSLSTGYDLSGELLAVFSGEGETDGLIQMLVDGETTPTNIYERHIVLLQRGERPIL